MSKPPRTVQVHWALLGFGICPLYFNGYINSHIASRPVAYWAFEFSYWILLPLLVLVGLVRFAGLRMSDIGIHGRIRGHRSIGALALISLVLCPLYYLVHSSALRYFGTLLRWRSTSRSLRGLAFRACEMLVSRPVLLYLAISPVLFALIHWESGAANTAASYIFGLLAAGSYVVLRNLWPLIVAHVYTDYAWFT